MTADEPVVPTCKVTTFEQRWERRQGTPDEVVAALQAQGWVLVGAKDYAVLLQHPSLAGVLCQVEP